MGAKVDPIDLLCKAGKYINSLKHVVFLLSYHLNVSDLGICASNLIHSPK